MEQLSQPTIEFIRAHSRDDVRLLALQAPRYPDVDMPAAIVQIAGRQAAANKIPSWQSIEELWYPRHLSMEQCSSEITAQYKSTLADGETLTDLTGGFGIDCAFMASRFRKVSYVERQEELCEIAKHNFPLLGLKHITVYNEDGVAHLQKMEPVDCIFIDPARRNEHGGKTIAISDCEPDVEELEELLLSKGKQIIIKLSPMLDLTLALHDLKHVQAAHVVSVNNECKELLLVLERGKELVPEEIPIHCINLTASQKVQKLLFTRQQEKEHTCPYTPTLKTYLYEPNASILKAGAFRSVSSIYNVEKLHPNSHLYTSDEYIPDFPGRKFRITDSSSLNKKELKKLIGTEKKANLTVRNFPASVAELRKRLKLAEGGDIYLFATTLADEKKLLIACKQP